MVFYGFASDQQRITMYPSWNGMLRLGWLVPKGSQRETRALEPETLLEQVGLPGSATAESKSIA